MLNSLRPALASLLILMSVVLAGCAPRKPVSSTSPLSSTSPSFRLISINRIPLLLSPAVPAQNPNDTSITFTVAANSDAPLVANTCLVTKGMFRVERNSLDSDFRVVLPPPNRWRASTIGLDETDIIDQLYSFLAAVDQSERAGCFKTTNGEARDSILQNVPTRSSDSLFNAYGYRIERSGVNLKSNLRLKVERAYFSSSDRSDKNYLGLSDVLFDVTPNSDGSLRFQKSQPIHYSPTSLAQIDHEGSRDLAILDLKPRKHYRILFYAHHVPTDQSFSAALIGADDARSLGSGRRNNARRCQRLLRIVSP